MQTRPYQQLTVDSVKLNQVNLIVAPMRAGKSYIMKLIVDKYQFRKVLIIVGYRKIVEQLDKYFPSHTHILSGKPFDHSKQVHLASFQTLANRDIDLSEYDCIIQDEHHSRTSKAALDVVLQPDCTILLFTGTPLTNRNKLIIKHIDNMIQPVTIKELIDNGWLAPTEFLTNRNIIGEHSSELATTKQDFDESVVRQLIQREHLLGQIRDLIIRDQLDTKHNTVIYVNFIETAIELHTLLADLHNVHMVHSQMTQAQQQSALNAYSSKPGVLINIRSLSLGWDSPRTDRLIFALFTKIHSLALQILWRASTIDPTNPQKLTRVYDLTGQLNYVNPYTDFKHYSSKLSCPDECIKSYPDDPMAQFFCIESCTSNPVLTQCNGKLPSSHASNPIVSNFLIHSGQPCMQARPVWEFKHKQTDLKPGVIRKWTKCSCGCITSYDVKTQMEPIELIQTYSDSAKLNTVTVIYSGEHHMALGLFDNPSTDLYDILMFNSSSDLYTKAVEYFNNKPFQILSNAKLNLPNVTVNRELNAVLRLIDWNGNNSGFIRKLIQAKLTSLCNEWEIKPGFVWHSMKHVNASNEKKVLTFLNLKYIDRHKIVSFFKKLQGN
jgi:hypothetical protein